MTKRYWLVCLLIAGTWWACQRESGALVLSLDRPLKNSLFMGWRFRQADTLTTDPFETVNNLWGSQIIGIRSVDVDAGGRERFRLGLIDADRDGRYHTIGTDQVILSEYGRDSAAIDPYLPSQGPLKSQTFIQVNRETYLLLDIDSLGRSVQLIPWEGRPPTDPTARLKTFLGKVPVQTLAGEPTYLQLSDAPSNTLLLLWSLGPDRGALLRTIAEQQESWADSLQFLTINSLDRAAQVETFLSSLPCDFPTYQVTDKTCVALGCHAALPIGWLLAPDGTLLRQRMHAREIMDYLGLSLLGS